MSNKFFLKKIVIITGAATGIASILAKELASQGAYLALGDSNEEALQLLSSECIQRGARVLIVPTQVANQEQCRRLIDKTLQHYQHRIDILMFQGDPQDSEDFEQWDETTFVENTLQNRFLGSVYCIHHALPYLKRSQGRIVGLSTLNSYLAASAFSGEIAGHHAMTGFLDSLASELAPHHVSVTLVNPLWDVPPVKKPFLRFEKVIMKMMATHSEDQETLDTQLILEAIKKRKQNVELRQKIKIEFARKSISAGIMNYVARRFIEKNKGMLSR
ncbi:SDR family NAD(P)-dependent oxidoreductase [Deltaproteobacteria bacterium TL4]